MPAATLQQQQRSARRLDLFWQPAHISTVAQTNYRNTAAYWPLIAEHLERVGIYDRDVAAAAIATVAIETASTFAPIEEYRNADGSIPSSWHGYDGGAEYHGRGFIQLTHKYNYRFYGNMTDVDLVAEPWRALEPDLAARLFALYFRQANVHGAARAHDWREVRRRVQGGYAALDRLTRICETLLA